MFALNFDFFLKKLFKKRWELEKDLPTYSYSIPKIHQLKVNSEENLTELFKYPSHYKHHTALQYNSAFLGYFSLLVSVVLYSALKMRKKSKVGTLVLSGISLTSFYEAFLFHSRVKDVKYIGVKLDGKTVVVKTFQDNTDYHIDIKDIRFTNKDREELIVFTDRQFGKDGGKFQFFFMEPTYANVVDKLLFEVVFVDRRYLVYYN